MNQRIKGWMGRADQATKVRGMFVHPMQVAELVRRHNEISAARVIVSRDASGNDDMALKIEARAPAVDIARISETLLALTRLRGRVVQVPADSLPKDGIFGRRFPKLRLRFKWQEGDK